MAMIKKTTRWIGFVMGGLILAVTFSMIFGPFSENWLNKGPSNTGHVALNCQDCHVDASGSVRQQIQGKVHFWIGLRSDDVNFGHMNVENQTCISCHERSNDKHPVSRFAEEQFLDARKAFSAHTCAGCHAEHAGVRVTMPASGCKHCHGSLKVKNDPIDVSHETLVSEGQWVSCLGCHDFHGNFLRKTPTKLEEVLSLDDIERYLNGGPSIYGNVRRFTAKEKGT